MLVDITQRKRSEEQLRLLLNELNHHVKNTLAAVQSIFAQTFPDSEGDARAKDAFEGRVLALSKARDLLTKRRLATASQVPVAEAALDGTRRPAGGRAAPEGFGSRLIERGVARELNGVV